MSYTIYIIIALILVLFSLGIVLKQKTKTPINNDAVANTWSNKCPKGYICEYDYKRNQYLIRSKIK